MGGIFVEVAIGSERLPGDFRRQRRTGETHREGAALDFYHSHPERIGDLPGVLRSGDRCEEGGKEK